ncbi:MAG: PfaD family polyunsaturated fatty acid/polyketide biosynthesis protein [Anaerolineaceae bacterium]|nr:PfaD family polyunsaturated fatty acid/polyketide biosynthesis protein [Anaerolineaceae bacterium]
MTFSTNPTPALTAAFPFSWHGTKESLKTDSEDIAAMLRDLSSPLLAVRTPSGIDFTSEWNLHGEASDHPVMGFIPPTTLSNFGDPTFLKDYGVRAAYYAGAMANGIASAEMVIALGKTGLMGSFGAGGLGPARLESAIQQVQTALPNGPYIFNLLHNPYEPSLEQKTVELYLQYGVRVVEAAAFVLLSASLTQYRAVGLSRGADGRIQIGNKVIAKVSRREVAEKFMSPASERILRRLLAEERITEEQAELARQVPMADDITIEADSGGHTDNRPLVCLLPSILTLRDEMQAKFAYDRPIRIGIAGGISTPESMLAAYMMGAAYVVTGSINHASVEAATSDFTKQQLAQASMTDVTMAPSADMFEMGVRVQVLKRGTLYPMRAQKLYDLYKACDSIDALPEKDRVELEEKIFKRPLNDVWQDTVAFFQQRDPSQIEKASQDPKKQMALIFRWYLGLASRWSCTGETGREMDYQIWCGPSMGAFNDWARGTYLEALENRGVGEMAWQLLLGTAYRYRLQSLRAQGVPLSSEFDRFIPMPDTSLPQPD